ncbi:MAG: hypothetical protein L0G90_00220, partial [Corynebacterium glyciniphilum]|nr:hypothetical protein [Corynebacterium glyciniphilum]
MTPHSVPRPGRSARKVGSVLGALMISASLAACVTNEESGNPDGWVDTLPHPVTPLQERLPQEYRASRHNTAS